MAAPSFTFATSSSSSSVGHSYQQEQLQQHGIISLPLTSPPVQATTIHSGSLLLHAPNNVQTSNHSGSLVQAANIQTNNHSGSFVQNGRPSNNVNSAIGAGGDLSLSSYRFPTDVIIHPPTTTATTPAPHPPPLHNHNLPPHHPSSSSVPAGNGDVQVVAATAKGGSGVGPNGNPPPHHYHHPHHHPSSHPQFPQNNINNNYSAPTTTATTTAPPSSESSFFMQTISNSNNNNKQRSNTSPAAGVVQQQRADEEGDRGKEGSRGHFSWAQQLDPSTSCSDGSALVRVDHPTPAQQPAPVLPAELVTMSNSSKKDCGTGGGSSSDLLSSTFLSCTDLESAEGVLAANKLNHPYNAVFLVDGLHKGIRIDNQPQQQQQQHQHLLQQADRQDQELLVQQHANNAGQHVHAPQTYSTGPLLSLSTLSMGDQQQVQPNNNQNNHNNNNNNIPKNTVRQPASSFGLPSPPTTPITHVANNNGPNSTITTAVLLNKPNPESHHHQVTESSTCIRISSPPLPEIPQNVRISSPLMAEIPQNVRINSPPAENLQIYGTASDENNGLIDEVHVTSSAPAPAERTYHHHRSHSQSLGGEKRETASRVLLPVPSSRTVTAPAAPSTETSVTPTQRTLISTEAQTDSTDFPGTSATTNNSSSSSVPPHPPRSSREHRKRERRERHLRRSCHHQGSQTGGGDRPHNSNRETRSEARRREAPPPPHPTETSNAPTNLEEQSGGTGGGPDNATESLPDILNSHQPPPPYSTLPPGNTDRRFTGVTTAAMPMPVPIVSMPTVLAPPPAPPHHQFQIPVQLPLAAPPPPPPPAVLVPQPASCLQSATQAPTIRYHFSPTIRANRSGSVRGTRSGGYGAGDDEPKTCCGMSTSQAVSIRWFILIIAVIGICCTVVGTTLGAAYSNGREHLTLSLLMIGVGVVLLTVSAVAWRLTSHEVESSCPSLLGFVRHRSSRGDGGTEPNRRFIPRLAPSYGRPHHPYAAMMYPEFQYRPPPPSYQASMQEYRLRLLLLERSNPTVAAAATLASASPLAMGPPPPAYRPYTGTLRPTLSGRNGVDPDLSRPPSYRSRSSGGHPGQVDGTLVCQRGTSLDPSAGHHHHHHHHLHHVMLDSPLHSRNPSLLSYLSQQSMGDNVSVVSGHGTPSPGTVVTVMQAVSVGMDLGLDMEMYEPDGVHHHHLHHHHGHDDGKGLPEESVSHVVELTSEKCDGESEGKDGNLVRIVQTTDSSQVIGRDSVIVTVSGSNQTLWDQSLQHANNQHNNNNNTTVAAANRLAIHHHPQGSPTIMTIHSSSLPLPSQLPPVVDSSTTTDQQQQSQQQESSSTSQVQILAHL